MGQAIYKTSTDHFETIDLPDKPLRDISVLDITGKPRTISEFLDKNKAILFVNVASECGYTDEQYKGLVKAYGKYHKRGLEILAFPCNQFNNQERFPESEIRCFVRNRNVKFPVFSKIKVNGSDTHDIYKSLKIGCNEMNKGNGNLASIQWNFSKFLVKSDGEVVKYFSPNSDFGKVEQEILKLIS